MRGIPEMKNTLGLGRGCAGGLRMIIIISYGVNHPPLQTGHNRAYGVPRLSRYVSRGAGSGGRQGRGCRQAGATLGRGRRLQNVIKAQNTTFLHCVIYLHIVSDLYIVRRLQIVTTGGRVNVSHMVTGA